MATGVTDRRKVKDEEEEKELSIGEQTRQYCITPKADLTSLILK
jgi:hypothetical protein